MKSSLLALVTLFYAVSAGAQVRLLDFGSGTSAVWEGFEGVTLASSGTAFWAPGDSVVASGQRLLPDEGGDPPAISTSAITEDAHTGTTANTLQVDVPPGRYQVWALCGTSERERDRFFDFTLAVPGDSARVRIEGGRRFRAVRLRTNVRTSPLEIDVTPRSAWCIAAIVIAPETQLVNVEADVIRPIEEWTFRMPPDEWEKWRRIVEPEPAPLPEVGSAARERGFVVYAQPWEQPVFPHTRPVEPDLDPELRLFATLGEYEPTTFTLHGLRDIRDIRVHVTDLGPIPASEVDIRKVSFTRARPNFRVRHRYRVVPDALERFNAFDLAPEQNQRIWLTVHVPPATPAGSYSGAAVVSTTTDTVEIPIRLRVLPIHLRENPDRLYAIYYRHPYDRMRQAVDPVSRAYWKRRAELEHADMAAHGIRNTVLSVWSPAADEEGRFDFDWDHLQAKLDLWDRVGFRGPIVMGIPTRNVYRKHVGRDYGSHLSEIRVPPDSFSLEMTAMVRAIEAERKRRAWPEFLYYPVDEPGRDSTSIAFMKEVLKAVRAAGVRTYLTASPVADAFQPLRPYVDVWCTQPFLPPREQALADMARQGIEYWCYPNHVNGENDHTPVAGARMTFGFGFWQSGFRSLIPWIYSWSTGDPRNYLDGGMSDFLNRHEPDGTPVPVALWEGYREGWDDARYVYTLESLVRTARDHIQPEVRRAAAGAQSVLDDVWNAIPVQPKYKYDGLWSPSEFNVYRWMIADQILHLQQLL